MRIRYRLILCGVSGMIIAASATSPLTGAPPASEPLTITARPQSETAYERVSYADLNLAQAVDQNRLYRRVRNASHRVCTSQALGVTVSDEEFVECSRTARKGAAPQVALAIERAVQIAATGHSDIPVITVAVASAF